MTYAYDAEDRPTRVVNPQGDRTTTAYDAAGRQALLLHANGARTKFCGLA